MRALARGDGARRNGARRLPLAAVTQTMLDLTLEPRREGCHRLGNVALQVVDAEIAPSEIAGIHEVEHPLQDLGNPLARRQIPPRDAPRALVAQIAVEQLSGDVLQGRRRGFRCGDNAHA